MSSSVSSTRSSSATLAERLKKFDSQNTVSNEFRVYTVQGAVLSIVTVVLIVYFVASEVYFNFQLTLTERVHVNATNPRGLEMEFDISFPVIPCSQLSVDAHDPTGQAQSLHLDKDHHVWKHRFTMQQNGKMKVHLGDKEKLELGSTLLTAASAAGGAGAGTAGEYATARQLNKEGELEGKKEEEVCGSCYGAGEEGECCNSCDDVKRAYNRMGWKLSDPTVIKQCRDSGPEEQPGEGCNVHGIVALDSGGGNLHFAPAEDALKPSSSEQDMNILDLLLNNFRQWNVTHTIHKLRFGPKYPAGVYQLNGETRIISDTHGMYQYYVQVRWL